MAHSREQDPPEEKSTAQPKWLKGEILRKEMERKELTKALEECSDGRRLSISSFLWRSFLFFGAAVAAGFLLTSFYNRPAFKEGLGILWSGILQMGLLLVIFWLGSIFYRSGSASRKRTLEWMGTIGLVLILLGALIFFRGVIGIVSRIDLRSSGASIWTSSRFLGALLLNGMALAALYWGRRRLIATLEAGCSNVAWTKDAICVLEGLAFYFLLSLLFQLAFQIDTFSILGAVVSRGLLGPILFPIFGYLVIRRLLRTH